MVLHGLPKIKNLNQSASWVASTGWAWATVFARAKLGKKLIGGWENDLLYLAGALTLLFLGAGALSLDVFLPF